MLSTDDKRNDAGAFLLISPRPNVFNGRISEMGQRSVYFAWIYQTRVNRDFERNSTEAYILAREKLEL